MPCTVAALFVESCGVYSGLEGVDAWGVDRDARLYRGAAPVIAHPPCERWGRYWSGGPSAKLRRLRGDDGGCFASALWSVRTFGGVLEHPEASSAWDWFGLERPALAGGWTDRDRWGGASCCVAQWHWGHRARKATWLYVVGAPLPKLIWGMPPPGAARRLDDGHHNAMERGAWEGPRRGRITAAECAATPPRFADLMLKIARAVEKNRGSS